MIAVDPLVRQEAFGVVGKNAIENSLIRLLIVKIEGDAGVDQLGAGPQSPSKGVGPIHAMHHLRRDGRIGLVIERKRGQHFGIVHPLFQHLRRRLNKVALQIAAESGPGTLPLEDPVHQVTELVEEGSDFTVFHQSGIARLAAGKIADQRRFGQLSWPTLPSRIE